MTIKKDINVTLQWDKDVVPANESRQRGLLVDINAIGEVIKKERAVNLALVIDRSGSMRGGRVEAAKAAAIGVVERLGEEDVLSVIDFDDKVTTLVNGLSMDSRGQREAVQAINTLRARGTTDLAGGWFEGARAAAQAMEETNFANGHVVLLSDGHANVGIQDPVALQRHASEMASRGITTSTVGVGDGYSPLQLEALSEGGLGRLHDAANPEEIVETILGELGEVRSIIATDAELRLEWPAALDAELLSNFDTLRTRNSMTVRIGHLLAGATRSVPVLFHVPRLPSGEVLEVTATLEGKDPETNTWISPEGGRTTLRVVPPEESRAVQRDYGIAGRIALLWESTLGLDAMRLNERGDFAAARHMVRDAGETLSMFAAGTDAEIDIRRNLHRAAERVSRYWDGRSKREAMIAAKKFSKGERDHRSNRRGDWSEQLDR